MMSTVTIVTDRSKRPSCMVALQKPLRWLMKQAYRFVYGSGSGILESKTTTTNFSKTTGFTPSSSSIHVKFEDAVLPLVLDKRTYSFISPGGAISDEDLDTPCLLNLPIQVRQLIYDLIEEEDILTLRLTCTLLKNDVESCHGMSVRVHDGRLRYEEALEKFGISRLTIERLVDDNFAYARVLAKPQLLKALVILGQICSKNLEFLLKKLCNLKELTIHFQFSDQQIPTDTIKSLKLDNLTSLHISCISPEISASPSVSKSILDFLNDITCPNIQAFKFHLVGLLAPPLLQDYQEHAYKFITSNESLKKVDIELRQLQPDASVATPEREDILFPNDGIFTSPKITMLQIQLLNSNSRMWHFLIDSQAFLRFLHLQMDGLLWNRLILTLDRNARTLTSLSVSSLCSTSQDGSTIIPIDFGLLRNLRALESLSIQHTDMESRGLEPPPVMRTSSLPLTLKTIRLCHLRLKPHQAMFLLVKLPALEELHLESWSDTEGALAGYFSVITFLIKFDVTYVKSIVLVDSRRRLENLRYEVEKMMRTLSSEANIMQINTELYSKLKITRYI